MWSDVWLICQLSIGHPVLFSTIEQHTNQSIDGLCYFGLPGNVLASAVTLRFLVLPYIHHLCHIDHLSEGVPFTLPTNFFSTVKLMPSYTCFYMIRTNTCDTVHHSNKSHQTNIFPCYGSHTMNTVSVDNSMEHSSMCDGTVTINVRPFELLLNQSSTSLSSLVQCNAWIMVPAVQSHNNVNITSNTTTCNTHTNSHIPSHHHIDDHSHNMHVLLYQHSR